MDKAKMRNVCSLFRMLRAGDEPRNRRLNIACVAAQMKRR